MKTTTYLMTALVLGLALGLTGTAALGDITSGLVGYWPLDGDAADASGNGLNGTLVGDVQFAEDRAGMPGGAALFPGVMESYIDLGDPDALRFDGAMTLAAWARADDFETNGRLISRQGGGTQRGWSLNIEGEQYGHVGAFHISPDAQTIFIHTTQERIDFLPEEWFHMAGVYRPGEAMEIYINGQLDNVLTDDVPAQQFINNQNVNIGRRPNCCPFAGSIDDVYVFSRALAEIDIAQLYAGSPGIALDARPAHGATDVPYDTSLTWSPGEFAVTHDVYVGTVFDDVNDADRTDTQGLTVRLDQDAASFDPGILDFSETYHWRVDEVNGPPDNAIYRGNIWSFTVEPQAIPIEHGNMTVTASSVHNPDTDPEKSIDGSGINPLGQHSTGLEDMWLCAATDTQPWIQFAFAEMQKLHGIEVWNHNSQGESLLGYGIKEALLEYSLDGVTWTVFGTLHIPQAPGKDSYSGLEGPLLLDGIVAQYVKLSSMANWSSLGLTQLGLSEVRFLGIPMVAREPNPKSGTAAVAPEATLSWRAGRLVNQHHVYVGIDRNDLPLVAETPENQLDASTLDLQLGETYYWQVNEVNEAETPPVWEGTVWDFSTPESLIVDDMESYADQEGQWIWETWVDGFEDPANGATVGHGDLPETGIVHSGNNSMPLFFDNRSAAISEATRTFDSPQDWTQGLPQALVLYFNGDLDNIAGQLYVKINNATVPFGGSEQAISTPFWTQWNVSLEAVGTDLGHVDSLTIGIEGANAQGVLYIDTLRLYGQAPEALAPQDPGTDNLVAYYAMENDATDSSGNGNDGTPVGDPLYAPGVSDMAMAFDGIDDRLALGPLDVVGSGITLSLWLNPESYVYDDTRVLSKATGTSENDHWWMISTDASQHRLRFRLKTDDGASTMTLRDRGSVPTGEWTHAAATWDGSTMRVYQNLVLVASTAKGGTAVAVDANVTAAIGNQPEGAGDKHWQGLIDEVRIYNRGLSEAELMYIALE